jgi:imidazolonepropionase-like amidohydrolase
VAGHGWIRRRITTGPVASLKIASGCDRRCAFCAIPSFRGSFVSRPAADVLSEARWLAEQGARELVLVSENSTSYGKDLADPRALERLVADLAEVPEVLRIRVSYLQPAEVRPGLLEAMAGTPGVMPWYDLSFQHSAPGVLRRMRRFGSTERFLERWHGHPLITAAVAPHATYTVSAEHLKAAHALAVKHGAPVLIHLAEARSEVELIQGRHGMGPVELLESLGILDDRVVAAHMIWPNPNEITLLATRGVGVAHCPESNMKGAAGVAPVPAMLAAGVAVGLGTDGSASNNDLSLWEEMDSAAKLHKLTTGDPTVVDARTAVAMATRLGARALGLEGEIGSLEAGKRADLILVRTDGLHQLPWYDPYSLLVYSTKSSDVDTVIVNGQLVMAGGRVLTVDEAAVRARAASYQQLIAAALAEPKAP